MNKTPILILSIAAIIFASCNSDTDSKGRMKIDRLKTASGKLNFALMTVSDSASRLNHVPDTFYYDDKPFSGTVVNYQYDTIVTVEGNIKNGIMDGDWTFYYPSGGVKMKGKMCNGRECGLWQSYYGYDKVNIEKEYDEHGFLLLRKEFYDNGKLKNIQFINSAKYGKNRKMTYDKFGNLTSIYVQDSINKIIEQ